jgi:uncharacterized protein (DUF302 family)
MPLMSTRRRRSQSFDSQENTVSNPARPDDDGENLDGLTIIRSSSSYADVVARLTSAIEHNGLVLLGRVDHAGGARAVGLELASEEVVWFGNAAAGTPLMQSDPRVGLELPLRMLIWQDRDGTRLAYRDPRELANAYDLAGREEILARMNALLAELAAAAAG